MVRRNREFIRPDYCEPAIRTIDLSRPDGLMVAPNRPGVAQKIIHTRWRQGMAWSAKDHYDHTVVFLQADFMTDLQKIR
jgi:hypothetical protein